MSVTSRPPPLNLTQARLKHQQTSFDKPPDVGSSPGVTNAVHSSGSSGSLSPNLQPPTPPTFPVTLEPFVPSRIGNYLILNQIEGSALYRCLHSVTQQEFVCKVVGSEKVRESLSGHFRLDGHPHVNGVEEVLVGPAHAYLLYQRSYGDLHSHVRTKRRLREAEALALFRQVADAVAACHDAGIVLRDLKLRKFVFKNPERTELKLETLDDGVVLEDGSSDDWLCDKHGCPVYVSPEILTTSGSYSGKAADCWSLGVMLYTMLVGRYPFHDADPALLFNKIRRGIYHLPETLSVRSRCLIRSLLRREPEERLTADEVLDHPWFKAVLKSSSGSSTSSLSPDGLHPPIRMGGSGLLQRDDAKVPDQTVPDMAVPEDGSSMFS